MQQDKTFLGTEPVGKLLLKLAVPTVAAQFVNMLYNIVDRIYIGHMGADGSLALTGVGVCMPIILIISAFAAFVSSGGAPRASIAMGAGDNESAEKILGGCFTLQLCISVALTAVLLIWNRDLLLTFGASENTIDYAVDYMNIYAVGTIFVQLTLGMNAFITAQGFAKTGMYTVLIGAAANIVLDPLFIFVFDMGVAGSTGSGKSYFANELVIQAIIKGWQVVICDLKRSYGLYKGFTDYSYEIDDILVKLKSVEAEMNLRMKKLQPELDKNPKTLAVDIGYKPMLVVIEEYISLQASLDKKQKEELERVVKNISVLARQSNIHMMIVLQSAGTENINSTTRSNLTKVLLGNAQSNILSATFGTGVDLPCVNTKLSKGQGLIALDRITILRVPMITDMENFKEVVDCGAVG